MLIERLAGYRRKKPHEITLVFDGWKSGGVSDSIDTVSGIRVIYSRLGDTADTAIKRMVSAARKDWIVITSDRDIISHVWASDAVPVRSEVFERILGDVLQEDFPDGEPPSDEDDRLSGKGTPGTLSKKEKAVRRAVNKLL